MIIRELQDHELGAWDDAIETLPEGTFCHLSGWREIIKANFGFAAHFLVAEDDTGIVGALPLYHVKRWPFTSALISSPVCVYGGSIAISQDIHQRLGDAAIDLARKLEVGYVELRDQSIVREDWHLSDLYFTFRKPLPASTEETLTAIPTRQRAEVRKGINADLTFATDSDLESFYPVYTSSIRALGSPGFHGRFYQSLLDVFGDRAEVATARHQGKPMSSVINFYYKNQVLLYYGGSLPQARELRSTQFLYWQIMNHALERGAEVFDFGRSMRDTGTYSFKKNWKFEPQPLHYHYFPINSKVPEIRPDNPTYALASRAWSHMPLPVAKLIGPFVARAIV